MTTIVLLNQDSRIAPVLLLTHAATFFRVPSSTPRSTHLSSPGILLACDLRKYFRCRKGERVAAFAVLRYVHYELAMRYVVDPSTARVLAYSRSPLASVPHLQCEYHSCTLHLVLVLGGV